MKQHWKTNKGKFKGEVGVWEPENQRRKSPQERNTFSTDIVPEKAILVSVCDSKTSMERTEECLNELAFLLETAGGVPVKTVSQKLDHPDSRTYIGSGKLEEVIEYKNALDADFLVPWVVDKQQFAAFRGEILRADPCADTVGLAWNKRYVLHPQLVLIRIVIPLPHRDIRQAGRPACRMVCRIGGGRAHPAVGMAERRLFEIAVERQIRTVLRHQNRCRRQ